MNEITAFANSLADEAGKIISQYFRKPFDVETKSDESPVTVADRAVEKKLREMIEAAYPDDGILGEEFGRKESQNDRTWVIDPIDGTKSFVIGRATFGTLIALCEDGVPVLGIIDQPIMKERWVGVKDKTTTYTNRHLGADFHDRPVKTARCSSLEKARIGSTTPAMFGENPVYKKFNEKSFYWGGDCYQYGLLALGFADVVIEAELKPYDFAALVPIIKGAGGHITDWDGNELTLESDGRVIALGDPALWPEVRDILK